MSRLISSSILQKLEKRVFVYEGHMIVRRKVTTWQRCAYQFSITPESINQLTVGVRHVKFVADVQSYLPMREILL